MLLLGCPPKPTPELSMPAAPSSPYPETRRVDVVDDYHGTPVADPYRWLEDSDDPEVASWVEAQNALTNAYLAGIDSREPIRERMTQLWDYERFSSPSHKNGRYFWYYNDGLMSQSVLYTADDPMAEGRVLLDPNSLSEDGTVALSGTYVNEDATKMVYAVSDAGSDWKSFHLLDIETGEKLPDELGNIKFSGATWAKDGSGFWYSAYAEADTEDLEAVNKAPKLYWHTLGTDQTEDTVIYDRPEEPDWSFGSGRTEDGRYHIISGRKGTEPKNQLMYRDLKGSGDVVELIMEFDAYYWVVGNDGPIWYVETDLDAPKGRVVAIDIRKPERENWKEVLPEGEDKLRSVSLFGKKMVVSTLHDVTSRVRVLDLKSGKELSTVELPGLGSVYGFGGRRDAKETFYTFSSYLTPGAIYRYDIETGTSTLFRAPSISMNADDYVVEQVFYPSKDGTEIPMFLVHHKDVALDSSNGAYLYGYGGFDIAITPRYSTVNRVWLEMGGVLAVANLRGGGEYGADWHDAGRLKNKQNVFDDFIAAGEWLIENKYTSADKLAIGGRSNGGLLVGACMTQRPDLFGAALPGVGVLDMIRFNKFTIGWAWESDYGSPEDPELFDVLYSYSPYHNLKSADYPATMVTTGDHDDRVVPGHSFKFAAELQNKHTGDDPVLIRIETRAGHGAGKPTHLTIAEWTDQWAFLVKELDMTLPEGFGATE
jgi:prolyl oligopeptidase